MAETWTVPPVQRTDPGLILGERQALEAWLDFHETLLLKCAGLAAGQLKERAVPPSRLSLLGLVRHMTEVERWWFRTHAPAGSQAVGRRSRRGDLGGRRERSGVHKSVDDLCKTALNLCAPGEMLGIPAATRAHDGAATGENAIHTLCTTTKLKLSTRHAATTRK
jgi:hypothetical protein